MRRSGEGDLGGGRFEQDSGTCQGVDIGGDRFGISVAGQVIAACGVQRDQHDIGSGLRREPKTERHQCQQQGPDYSRDSIPLHGMPQLFGFPESQSGFTMDSGKSNSTEPIF